MATKEELIQKLRERESKIEPGDNIIFDFVHVRNLLNNLESFGYGHSLNDRKIAKKEIIKLAHSLLGIPFEESEEG
jgi:hypothetical protein